jgi:hypothetical protein
MNDSFSFAALFCLASSLSIVSLFFLSFPRALAIRAKFYDLLTHCIPAEVILRVSSFYFFGSSIQCELELIISLML